jgi:formylglycine-generating enzyme required for sulfatase activity
MSKIKDFVTNEEWAVFRLGHSYPEGHGRKAVVNITHTEAMQYCKWLSEKLSRETGKVVKVRLPTEDELIAAEKTFQADFSNHPLKEPPDVGTFGSNADGVSDLKGCWYTWVADPSDVEEMGMFWGDLSGLVASGPPDMAEAPKAASSSTVESSPSVESSPTVESSPNVESSTVAYSFAGLMDQNGVDFRAVTELHGSLDRAVKLYEGRITELQNELLRSRKILESFKDMQSAADALRRLV